MIIPIRPLEGYDIDNTANHILRKIADSLHVDGVLNTAANQIECDIGILLSRVYRK